MCSEADCSILSGTLHLTVIAAAGHCSVLSGLLYVTVTAAAVAVQRW